MIEILERIATLCLAVAGLMVAVTIFAGNTFPLYLVELAFAPWLFWKSARLLRKSMYWDEYRTLGFLKHPR